MALHKIVRHRGVKVVLLLIAADWSSTHALADEFHEAFDSKNYARAFEIARPTAEAGDARAQSNIGVMYEHGMGMPQDYGQAANWYRRAADQGNARAQLNLGILYLNGNGVPQDDREALRWWRKAAEKGEVGAMGNLGWAFANGRGVPRDDVQALAWYRKAAAGGDTSAKAYVARSTRATARFDSFSAAAVALDPDGGAMNDWLQNPMALKGQVVIVRVRVLQVLGSDAMLLTNQHFGIPQLDGKVYYGTFSKGFAAPRDVVDDQFVEIVAEIVGTQQYATAAGSMKTVPKVRIYGLRPS